MIYLSIAILFAIIFIYSISSRAIEKLPINGALFFCILGFAFGPYGFGFLETNIEVETIRLLAEMALALILFTDAANTDLKVLMKSIGLPRRLLLIGLPLTILFGMAAGMVLMPSLMLLEVALLATMLSPTDAALGKSVVTSPAVPMNIREGLTVESGLNDGICVPIVLSLLTVAIHPHLADSIGRLAVALLVKEIGIGLIVGIASAYVGSVLMGIAHKRHWLSPSWKQLTVAALALFSFSLAPVAGGSGFIASFTGGLAFGYFYKKHKEEMVISAEGIGDSLSLVAWVVFGAGVVGQVLLTVTIENVIYAILSLTVLRMVPVYIALWGQPLGFAEKSFIGWFGPRGLATIVFVIMTLDAHLPSAQAVSATAACTVFLSVVLHGLSANPFVRMLFGTKPKQHQQDH
ncbi:sodium:proton antiporter [Rhodobacteraceae bacterium RKSG542]|uniref:cation:proton antiporter n=1 Tax=Pseudovibrio flavus TaxID=2529854 RepID=UPI0012BCD07F|nr:cation:proton antiporter [Pseudovibrio flavus]MTI16862.1 sodium:proton antiporter [Pseudovibrio flavus]